MALYHCRLSLQNDIAGTSSLLCLISFRLQSSMAGQEYGACGEEPAAQLVYGEYWPCAGKNLPASVYGEYWHCLTASGKNLPTATVYGE